MNMLLYCMSVLYGDVVAAVLLQNMIFLMK